MSEQVLSCEETLHAGCSPIPPEWEVKTAIPFEEVTPFSPAELTESLARPTVYITKLFAVSDRSSTYMMWLMFATRAAATAFNPELCSAIEYPALLGRVLRARLGATTTTSMAGQLTNLHVLEMEALYDELFYPFSYNSLPPHESNSFFCRIVLYFPSKNGTMRYLHAQIKILVLE